MDKLIVRRKINDIDVSLISLGTMRFYDKGLTKDDLVALLEYSYHELGINTHHSSYEYNSYDLYCKALAYFKKNKNLELHHICKLSSPDFKDKKFSKAQLKNSILSELKNLNADRISILQWLYRTEPIDDAVRIPALQESLAEIEDAFKEFIDEGIVGTVGLFPYTIEFGEEVAKNISSNTGWISYYNFMERGYIDNLPSNQWMIGLRPLAAGKIFDSGSDQFSSIGEIAAEADLSAEEEKVMNALVYCFSDFRVKSNVISINSLIRAKQLKRIFGTIHMANAIN
jgi:predicted oxidoreductase